MTLNLTPNKRMLDLNFDENSSDEESPHSETKQQQAKFEKVYDLDVDLIKKDKFTSNKVQKGLFISQSDTFQYDTFEVKHKPQIYKPLNNPSKKHNPDTINQIQKEDSNLTKTKQRTTLKILSASFLQKSSSESENSENDQNSVKKKLQSETLLKSKKKLLELDFSQSSSDEQKKSQQSQGWANLQQKSDAKKPSKQGPPQEKEQQRDSSKFSEQKKLQPNSKQQKHQQVQEEKPIPLKDFQFTKQPQYEVLDQIRPEQRLRAVISRCRSGLNILWPQYEIKIQSNDQHILFIKKEVKLLKGQYKIYNRTLSGKNRYFGRLQANISGTDYQIFISQNGVHQNLKAEMYFHNDAKSNQPRYFIMISLIDGYNISDLVVTDPSNISLKELYKNQQNKSKMIILHTRKPVFHESIRGFVLNFSGRVNLPSIKNFILEDVNTQKEVLMFGKINKDNFRLQVSSPLNCVIGAAVALIQFEGRFME